MCVNVWPPISNPASTRESISKTLRYSRLKLRLSLLTKNVALKLNCRSVFAMLMYVLCPSLIAKEIVVESEYDIKRIRAIIAIVWVCRISM